jgi:hypothetical protein
MEHLDHRRGPRDGRVYRQIRRCLVNADGKPVPFKELRAWVYAGDRRPWYVPIYRCLGRYGERVCHGWWRPNAALMKQIRGE